MGLASAERVLTMIKTETELDENIDGVAKPVQGEVVFENVNFAYNGNPVLKDVRFRVQPGETVAIVGHEPGRARPR